MAAATGVARWRARWSRRCSRTSAANHAVSVVTIVADGGVAVVLFAVVARGETAAPRSCWRRNGFFLFSPAARVPTTRANRTIIILQPRHNYCTRAVKKNFALGAYVTPVVHGAAVRRMNTYLFESRDSQKTFMGGGGNLHEVRLVYRS